MLDEKSKQLAAREKDTIQHLEQEERGYQIELMTKEDILSSSVGVMSHLNKEFGTYNRHLILESQMRELLEQEQSIDIMLKQQKPMCTAFAYFAGQMMSKIDPSEKVQQLSDNIIDIMEEIVSQV
jgi:hypothetical protein